MAQLGFKSVKSRRVGTWEADIFLEFFIFMIVGVHAPHLVTECSGREQLGVNGCKKEINSIVVS